MPKEDKIVAGLDLGTTKICAVVGKMNQYGKLDVIGFSKTSSEDGIRDGTVLNIQKTADAITKVIKELEEKYNIVISSANVGVAGNSINCFQRTHGIALKHIDSQITRDDISRLSSEMNSTLIEPGSQIVHIMPRTYTIDYQTVVKDPIGISGKHLEAEFNIITAKANNINNIKRSVELGGLKIDSLILEPLASSISVLSEDEKEAGVILIDIGGGTTDIAVFQDGIIRHTAVLPFGGDIITKDIKVGCSVLYSQAELLKVKHGRALQIEAPYEVIAIAGGKDRPGKEISSSNLAAIIEARMMEIIKFVLAEIKKTDPNTQIRNIVLTGGGAKLKHITQLFEYVTHMDTRIGFPNEHLGSTVAEEIKEPMYATAVGLVLAGFISVDQRENQWENSRNQPKKSHSQTSKDTSKSTGKSFFTAIADSLKSLLTDDFKGKEDFK